MTDKCWLEWDRGEIRKAANMTSEAVRIFDRAGIQIQKAHAYIYLAYFNHALGAFTEATANLHDALGYAGQPAQIGY